MLGKVFKAYDIRGVYPDPLNEKVARRIGRGVAKFLLEDAAAAGDTTPMMKNIVVGHDMRAHSPALRDALCEGIRAEGASVLDVGMVDTPFIYFAINHLDCAGGVQVTASHNPPQYNGFKVSKRHAKPVGESTGLATIREIAALSSETVTEMTGHKDSRDLWSAYRAHVHSFLRMNGRPLKVVIDASNGMAGTMVPAIFGKKGADVEGLDIVELNFDNSKAEFVHEPNPLLPSALLQVQTAVVKEKADFGVCFDGDADRLVVIDELGEVIGCDHLTAFLGTEFLKSNPGAAVVYDLRSSKAVEEDIRAAGGEPVRGRVGHVFLKALLAEKKGVFGGELSGHFYFRDNFNADSGAIALATVLSVVSASETPLSKRIAPIARYVQSGETNFEVEDKDAALDMLREEIGERGTLDELDGVTVDCFNREGWWCNVRKSNTEPLLRLNVEAKTQQILDQVMEEIAPLLGEPVAH